MPLNPEARRARARLAAHRRWHPGDDLNELTEQCMREIEQSNIDAGIDDLVARAPKMTPEQAARLHRLWNPPVILACDPGDDPAVRLSRTETERLADLLGEASATLKEAVIRTPH